jgi:hypothetical protein
MLVLFIFVMYNINMEVLHMSFRNVGFACMSLKCNTKYNTFRLASFSENRLYTTVIHNIQETERTIK